MMRFVCVVRGMTIGVSVVLLVLLGSCMLWLAAGDLVTNVRDAAALAAVGLQGAVLLCVMIMAICRAEGRWGWVTFLTIEALATVVSAACGVNWSAPGAELPMALAPLICALALAWLNAMIERMKRTEEYKDEQEA